MRKLFFLLLMLTTHAFSADTDALSITNQATNRQPIAIGSIAVAHGEGFTENTVTYGRAGELPVQLGGVEVTVGNMLAGIRHVAPTEIVFVVPVLRMAGWYVVTIKNDRQEWRGWTYVARAALGVYLQNGVPQGQVQNGRGVIPCLIGSPGCSIINTGETRIRLLGTGFFYAPEVWAVLIDESGREWWVNVRAGDDEDTQPIGNFLFAGLDYVAFKLPNGVRGNCKLLFYAPGNVWHWPSLSNAVQLTIE